MVITDTLKPLSALESLSLASGLGDDELHDVLHAPDAIGPFGPEQRFLGTERNMTAYERGSGRRLKEADD